MQTGIKETEELLVFLAKLPKTVQRFIEKGAGLGLIGPAIELLSKIEDAFGDLDQIPAELADLDSAEKARLEGIIKQNIELDNEQVETVVENSLLTVISLANIWKAYLPKADKAA